MSKFLLQAASTVSVSQGAEAKVYKAYLHEPLDVPVLLKHRFHKQYRHPSLDTSLTKSRITGEARALLKCLRAGVSVPGVKMVDVSGGFLGIDWIEGRSVRRLLPGGAEEEEGPEDETLPGNADDADNEDPLVSYGISQDGLMVLIGAEIAKMHLADIIHGDLTTSNIMLRHPSSPPSLSGVTRLVLIDFGLAYHSSLVEDKAVDLYVLERAFASTHPDSEDMFDSVLQSYAKVIGKEWNTTKRRLDEG